MSLGERINKFFQGRYGTDDLGKFMLVLMLIFTVLYMLTGWLVFDIITIIITVIIIYRMLSRDYGKRSAENRKYMELTEPVGIWISNLRSGKNSTHKVFLCPECRQKVRVPKGRGRIQITCPKCRHEFIKRS